jgi:hypothetical protein
MDNKMNIIDYMLLKELIIPFNQSLFNIQGLIHHQINHHQQQDEEEEEEEEDEDVDIDSIILNEKFNLSSIELTNLNNKIKFNQQILTSNSNLPSLTQLNNFKILPFFNDNFILSRKSSSSSSLNLSSLPIKKSSSFINPSKLLFKLSTNTITTTTTTTINNNQIQIQDEDLIKFELMPQIEDALDLKIKMSTNQFNFLKSTSQKDRQARKTKLNSFHQTLITPYTISSVESIFLHPPSSILHHLLEQ